MHYEIVRNTKGKRTTVKLVKENIKRMFFKNKLIVTVHIIIIIVPIAINILCLLYIIIKVISLSYYKLIVENT